MIKTSEEFLLSREDQTDLLVKLLNCSLNEILFLDIETTGLTSKSADIYLIGTGYYQNNTYRVCQFFAESPEQEEEILTAFSSLCRDFKYVVHFNGNRFDIPFLRNKFEKYNLEDALIGLGSFDLYKQIFPYKEILGLPDCKQKTIELYLGIDRDDTYDGGKLINIYKDYVNSKDSKELKLLLLHNSDDIKGLFNLLPMLKYRFFFEMFRNLPKFSIRTDEEIKDSSFDYDLPVKARKVQANYYSDMDGKQKKEVYMKLSLPFSLPSSLSGNLDECYFKAVGDEATLRVPLIEEELKYYYSNYKDYYYLPMEDMAIHKSIATFVDKSFREKATPENCYTKKEGQYLQEWDLVFAPFFKTDYQDKKIYFDLNENMKKSRFAMSLYASHVIAHILEM